MGFFDFLNPTVTIDGKVYMKRDVLPPVPVPKIVWKTEALHCNNYTIHDCNYKTTNLLVYVWCSPPDINKPRDNMHIYKDFDWGYTISESRASPAAKREESERRLRIVRESVENWYNNLKRNGYTEFSNVIAVYQAESHYEGDGYYM